MVLKTLNTALLAKTMHEQALVNPPRRQFICSRIFFSPFLAGVLSTTSTSKMEEAQARLT